MSRKRSAEPDEEDPKRRVADDDDTKYFLNRWTRTPIINHVLKREYNDLRSWLSQYPANIICYEIGPRISQHLPPGEVSENAYQLVPSPYDPTHRLYNNRRQYSRCCSGINGEIVVALTLPPQIVILDQNGTEQSAFAIADSDSNNVYGVDCVGVYGNGDLAVSTIAHDPIHVFSRSGTLLRSIDVDPAKSYTNTPLFFAIDDRDNLYVNKETRGGHVIYVYSSTGQHVREIDLDNILTCGRICAHNNHLYMADLYMAEGNNIVIVDLQTNKVTTSHQLLIPIPTAYRSAIDGIFIDANGNLVVIYGNGRGSQVDLFSMKDFIPVFMAEKLALRCSAQSICLGSNGDFWMATTNSGFHTIQRYSAREQPTGQSI
jgi:hypothetical protein